MLFYEVHNKGETYNVATFAEARKEKPEYAVLYDLRLDKANLLRLLNNAGGTHSAPLRYWMNNGKRGGLVEVSKETFELTYGF